MVQKVIFPLVLFCFGASFALAQSVTPSDSTLFQIPHSRGLEIEGETIICPGSITALKVKGQYASYQWSTGHQSPNVTIFKPGNYSVTVTTKGGCELTGTVTVRYSDSPCL